MQTSCCWTYFEGSTACLVPADDANPTSDEIKGIEAWDYEDLIAWYLLLQCLPNTTAICLSHYRMAKEHWSKVSEEYTEKSTYIQNDLEQAFLEMHCGRGLTSAPS